MTKDKLINKFNEIFKFSNNIEVFFSPGRVNLIGEHTDYNGGYVFPCAIDIGTYGVFRKRKDNVIRFYSVNFSNCGVITTNINNLVYDKNALWTNYPMAVVWSLINSGYDIDTGFDMLVYGNIPNSSGLSSSASIEVLTAYALSNLFNLNINLIDIALICQQAENKYIGVACGIMDQFAVAMGKKDRAILLNTSTLKYTYAPLELNDVSIVIANSNKKRGLIDSKYNERREECERALKNLQISLNIQNLCELTLDDLENNKSLITNYTDYKRARHVISENDRTLSAVSALEGNNIEKVGLLMNDSHISLRDDYEVTGNELDTLVEAAWECNGVIGSRMTGAGFGGCTVSLVENKCVEEFIMDVGEKYRNKTGLKADFYIVSAYDGACII